MPQRPELKQFSDLTPSDFERHPIWVDCHVVDYDEPWYDDTDEETYRPWAGPLPVEIGSSVLVRADFVGDIVKSCGSRADQAAVFPAFFGSSILVSSLSRSGCLPSTKRTPARTSGISA